MTRKRAIRILLDHDLPAWQAKRMLDNARGNTALRRSSAWLDLRNVAYSAPTYVARAYVTYNGRNNYGVRVSGI